VLLTALAIQQAFERSRQQHGLNVPCPRLIEQFLETRRSRDDEALNIIIIDRSN